MLAGAGQAFGAGLVFQLLHVNQAEGLAPGGHADNGGGAVPAAHADQISAWLHWLRDSALAAPFAVLALALATLAARRLIRRARAPVETPSQGMVWALAGSAGFAVASVLGSMVHARVFVAEHRGVSTALHTVSEAAISFSASFIVLTAVALAAGVPWALRGALREDAAPAPSGAAAPAAAGFSPPTS